jgi:hypothetical protein
LQSSQRTFTPSAAKAVLLEPEKTVIQDTNARTTTDKITLPFMSTPFEKVKDIKFRTNLYVQVVLVVQIYLTL